MIGIRRHITTTVRRCDKISKEEMAKHQKEMMGRGLPKRKPLEGVDKVVLVASGKGGVGKSTTAVNLALAMAKLKKGSSTLRVGLFDADIYGPSIPLMMSIDAKPDLTADGKMIPPMNYGLHCMSMGFLLKNPSEALAWRGPMVMGALEKMLRGSHWSDLDVLVVDTPPGTGDIHLSLAQTTEISGGIVVSTPQKIALADARKGITFFTKVNIPVLGLVENMSGFQCPKCDEITPIFGNEGVKTLAEETSAELLGQIPLDPALMRASDSGEPILVTNAESKTAMCYMEIASKIVQKLF